MKQAFTPQSETVQRILDREKSQPVMNREIRTFETTPLAGCNVTEEDMQKIEDSARTLTNIQSMATLKQKVIDLIDREFPTNIQPEHPLTQHAHQVIVDLYTALGEMIYKNYSSIDFEAAMKAYTQATEFLGERIT